MGSFISDWKNRFNRGDINLQFIYINVGIFVVTTLVSVFLVLFNWNATSWLNYLELPAWVPQFLSQPWSLFTYMFLHAGVLHLLFNMLWLYWFGQLFLSFFSARHYRGLYILGGLCGGLLYLLAFNVFPYFEAYVYGSYLLGASASVLAIVVATAVRQPEFRVNFMLVGAVRLKYVALFMVLTDLLFVTSGNGGGHIAHLGGALAGWWFAWSLQKGHDVTRWINQIFDWFSGGFRFKSSSKKPKMKVERGGRTSDYEYNSRKKQQSEEIDRILDKLKKSGYASLTTEEKKRLFDASKR
ncbi:MAG: rhomboid family intramembrane serine protease [Bacteroidaceae bacterium]|nr:rhomboid family intramembrane serine protease [Bacteroidaceae bacterium]